MGKTASGNESSSLPVRCGAGILPGGRCRGGRAAAPDDEPPEDPPEDPADESCPTSCRRTCRRNCLNRRSRRSAGTGRRRRQQSPAVMRSAQAAAEPTMMSAPSARPFHEDVRCRRRPVTSASRPFASVASRRSSAESVPTPAMASGRSSTATGAPSTVSPSTLETSTPPDSAVRVAAASATNSMDDAATRPSRSLTPVRETVATEISAPSVTVEDTVAWPASQDAAAPVPSSVDVSSLSLLRGHDRDASLSAAVDDRQRGSSVRSRQRQGSRSQQRGGDHHRRPDQQHGETKPSAPPRDLFRPTATPFVLGFSPLPFLGLSSLGGRHVADSSVPKCAPGPAAGHGPSARASPTRMWEV